jgi:hypothetical protein
LFTGLDSESDDEDDNDDCMDKCSNSTASTTDSVKRWSDEDDFDDVYSAGGCSPRLRPSPAGPPPGVHFVNQPPPGIHQGPPGVNQAPPGVHCVPIETIFWVPVALDAETASKTKFPAGPPGCWDGKGKKSEDSK